MLFFIQAALVIFFFFAIIKVVARFRTGDLSKKDAIVWVFFWIIASGIVLVPNSTARVAELFGIGRGADLVVYVALAGLFFIIFRLMVKIEMLNKDVTTLTRQVSLNQDMPAEKK